MKPMHFHKWKLKWTHNSTDGRYKHERHECDKCNTQMFISRYWNKPSVYKFNKINIKEK